MTPPRPTTNSEPFYWRDPILPRKQLCPVLLTPFVQPSQIERDSIRFDVDIRFDQISFEAEWDPPMYINGDFDHYQLCVRFSDIELEGQETCDNIIGPLQTPSFILPLQQIEGPVLIMQVINCELPSTSLAIISRQKYHSRTSCKGHIGTIKNFLLLYNIRNKQVSFI